MIIKRRIRMIFMQRVVICENKRRNPSFYLLYCKEPLLIYQKFMLQVIHFCLNKNTQTLRYMFHYLKILLRHVPTEGMFFWGYQKKIILSWCDTNNQVKWRILQGQHDCFRLQHFKTPYFYTFRWAFECGTQVITWT